MKLIDNFFQITHSRITDGSYVCKVKLNAQHPVYSVHFPGNPVTPGVCLLQIATELLEQEYGKRLLLSKAKSIKFKKIIRPDEEPTFVFTKLVYADQQLSVNISILVGHASKRDKVVGHASKRDKEDDQTQCAAMSLQFIVIPYAKRQSPAHSS